MGRPRLSGSDERRMQVRAYNYWASLLDDRNFPAFDDLDPRQDRPISAPSACCSTFRSTNRTRASPFWATGWRKNAISATPTSASFPMCLRARCSAGSPTIICRSLPIRHRSGSRPNSSTSAVRPSFIAASCCHFPVDDSPIDFIYGVINWKELADPQATDELLLEIDQALEAAPMPRRADPAPMADWADGPGMLAGFDIRRSRMMPR